MISHEFEDRLITGFVFIGSLLLGLIGKWFEVVIIVWALRYMDVIK